jgi:transposase
VPTLQAYSVRGKRYRHIVESYRDRCGRPRLRVVRHLGRAEKFMGLLAESRGRALCAEERELALRRLADRLRLVEIIDRHAPQRRRGASVGRNMLPATINRAVDPKSKAGPAKRYRRTILPRLLPLPPEGLCSQRFWDHMQYVDEAALAAIETDVTRRLSESPSRLARRGHAKSKRADLRIVGLALMVSWDFHVRLFSRVYEGNQPDSATSSKVLDDLMARYQMFQERCERITLVFDKGNSSGDNIEALDRSPYHVIGFLVPAQHQDLLDITQCKLRSLEGPLFEGMRVVRTEKEVFGRKRIILVTRSQALLRGQVRGIRQHLAKKLRALQDLQRRLQRSYQPGRPGKAFTREGLEKQLASLRAGQYTSEFLWARVRESDGRLAIEFGTDHRAYRRLKNRVLGKRVLFTTNPNLTDDEIVFGYRGRHHVERAFREMKDPCFIRFCPAFHRTDAMIRVHALHCVLALTLMSLLHREVVTVRVAISQRRLLEELKRTREITNMLHIRRKMPASAAGRGRNVS